MRSPKANDQTKLALERSARQFADLGMHAAACEALEKRAALSPQNPMIWNDLGVEYAAAGRLNDALSAFRRAHAALPQYPVALYNLGRFHLDRYQEQQPEPQSKTPSEPALGLATKAAEYLQTSLTHDPSLAHSHELLHKAFKILGNTQQADHHLAEAIRLNPGLRTLYHPSWIQRLPWVRGPAEYHGPGFLRSR